MLLHVSGAAVWYYSYGHDTHSILWAVVLATAHCAVAVLLLRLLGGERVSYVEVYPRYCAPSQRGQLRRWEDGSVAGEEVVGRSVGRSQTLQGRARHAKAAVERGLGRLMVREKNGCRCGRFVFRSLASLGKGVYHGVAREMGSRVFNLGGGGSIEPPPNLMF